MQGDRPAACGSICSTPDAALSADMTGLYPAAVSSPLHGASPLASVPQKPPLPQDVSLPEVSLPESSPEKEREPLLAAANDAVAAPAEDLAASVSSPGGVSDWCS